MTRILIVSLAILLAGVAPVLAQDCGTKSGDCSECADCGDKASSCSDKASACSDMKTLGAKLAKTKATLAAAMKKEEALSAEQRKQLMDARTFLMTKTADGKAFLPTLVANAKLLTAAAAQEPKVDGKLSAKAKVMTRMAQAYADIAGMMNPRSGKLAPVSVEEARAEVKKANALWAQVEKDKAANGCCADKDACKAAMKTVKELCTMKGAMGDTMAALATGYQKLGTTNEFVAAAAGLHAKLASCGSDCSDKSDCGDKTTKAKPATKGTDSPAPST